MLEIGFTILTISSIWMITKIWIIRMTTLWEKLFASIMTSATLKFPENDCLLDRTAPALPNLSQTIKIQSTEDNQIHPYIDCIGKIPFSPPGKIIPFSPPRFLTLFST